jgi:DNA-binding LytR/AlgR family response regulator
VQRNCRIVAAYQKVVFNQYDDYLFFTIRFTFDTTGFTRCTLNIFFMKEHATKIVEIPELISHQAFNEHKTYLSRIAVKKGSEYLITEARDIAFFKLENGVVFLITGSNKRFITAYNLLELEDKLDPRIFRRVSRQFIINGNYIKGFTSLGKSRFVLQFSIDTKECISISPYSSGHFREWIETCS